MITSFEDILTDQTTYTIDDQTNFFTINQTDLTTTTIQSKFKHENLSGILSLISLFCFFIILSSIVYGLWTIHGHYIWYFSYDRQIQLLFRRSIRSSTRSNRIETLAQIANERFSRENSISTWSIQSTISNTNL
jgi:hypothetical protein